VSRTGAPRSGDAPRSLDVATPTGKQALGLRFPHVLGAEHAPVVFVVAVIALVGNGSAFARLRAIASWPGVPTQGPDAIERTVVSGQRR
jgi:hypothetical protein